MQKEQHQKAAESDESSQSSARPKWDTPFNRALNILKKVPEAKPPSGGRVHAIGDGASWKMCYSEEPEERRKRRALNQQTIDEKVAIAVNKTKAKTKEELRREVHAAVNEAVAGVTANFQSAIITNLILAIIDWHKNNPEKGAEDFPLPSYVGSNSVNITPPAPAEATAKGPAPVHSSPTSVSGMLVGPSSMAELDAHTVITRHTLFTSMSI